uniref:PNPLA domain-containing protein n=1 Tax=Chelydra serpentina TaxID=8475 RepID=A0A8C3RTW1_CHESE
VLPNAAVWDPISLSFSGSGFLINYQVGVVQALRELAPEIMRSASKVYGASCGSVVAAAVVCLIKEFFHEAMEEVRKVSKLNVCPGYRPLRIIEKGLSQKLPENSHQLASGKLCISVTRLLDLQNVIISEYRSKEELIQAVICSCFLPVYCGFNPPSFQGMRYIDGGISNVQPGSDSETMITVSPYTGEVDICPRDCPAYFNCISFFQSTFQLSVENVCRFSYSIFPPSPPVSSLRDCTVPDHFSIANPKHVRTINQPQPKSGDCLNIMCLRKRFWEGSVCLLMFPPLEFKFSGFSSQQCFLMKVSPPWVLRTRAPTEKKNSGCFAPTSHSCLVARGGAWGRAESSEGLREEVNGGQEEAEWGQGLGGGGGARAGPRGREGCGAPQRENKSQSLWEGAKAIFTQVNVMGASCRACSVRNIIKHTALPCCPMGRLRPISLPVRLPSHSLRAGRQRG